MSKVLLVDDDIEILEKVADFLSFERYTVDTVANGRDALEHLRVYKYDVIILDWHLPLISGVQVCRDFRAQGGSTPILMLTGKSDILDKEQGLDAGADDYLTKPFHVRELSARLRALLRRPGAVTGCLLKIGHLELDPAGYTVRADGTEVQLQPLEFALLEFFMRHPGQVFPPQALLDRVWSSGSDATVDSVRTCVKMLRKKIDLAGQESIIYTVHGVGYKLEG